MARCPDSFGVAGHFSFPGVSVSLTAVAVSVMVSLSVAALGRTSVLCPHGGFLYAKVGRWMVNVQPMAHGKASCSRGDVAQCHCVRCRGKWYNVVSYAA